MVMTPRGPAASMTPLQTNIYGGGYSQNIRVNMEASLGINRGGGADWFGPQNPMAPTAPLEVAGRAWNFAPGYNLNQQPRSYEAVTFGMMKQLADGYDLMRLVIETRKDQIAKLKWKFRAKADADPKTKDKTTPDQQNRIDYLTSFFTKPDGVNRWRPWLRSLLEDKFVLDAATLYLRRNRGGQRDAASRWGPGDCSLGHGSRRLFFLRSDRLVIGQPVRVHGGSGRRLTMRTTMFQRCRRGDEMRFPR